MLYFIVGFDDNVNCFKSVSLQKLFPVYQYCDDCWQSLTKQLVAFPDAGF